MNPTSTTANLLKMFATFFEQNRLYTEAAIATAAILLFWAVYHVILKRAPRTWRLILSLVAGACGLLWGLSLLKIFFVPSSSTGHFTSYVAAILFVFATYGLLSGVFNGALKERPYSLRKVFKTKLYVFRNRERLAADSNKKRAAANLLAANQDERRRIATAVATIERRKKPQI